MDRLIGGKRVTTLSLKPCKYFCFLGRLQYMPCQPSLPVIPGGTSDPCDSSPLPKCLSNSPLAKRPLLQVTPPGALSPCICWAGWPREQNDDVASPHVVSSPSAPFHWNSVWSRKGLYISRSLFICGAVVAIFSLDANVRKCRCRILQRRKSERRRERKDKKRTGVAK